jgi:3-methyladenine DNA glycosylase/8-oxoguanine DNA glycosylase
MPNRRIVPAFAKVPRKMKLTIKTPPDFNFHRTVLSHGWCELPPFELDRKKWVLTRVLDSAGKKPITVRISPGKGRIKIETSRAASTAGAARIIADVRHMFRLDDDLRTFYQAMAADPDFAWIASEGAGRLLRSPTVFEDLVKMICTTNCSWALTEKMVNGLVDELGRESDDGRKSFPTAEAMAAQTVDFYRDKIRAGYRSAYLQELAKRVASGEIDVESWGRVDTAAAASHFVPTDQLLKDIKLVKGVGNYAAENLLKLIGRYDGLALDSWTRAQFAKARNKGRAASDKKIMRFYARFDSWRGLALWCDMTRHWLDPENIAKW